MGRAAERVELARRAISAFEEVIEIENPNSIERDAAIQRFEFTFEAVWKAAKEVLFEREGIDSGSPKSVIRSCRETAILDAEQTLKNSEPFPYLCTQRTWERLYVTHEPTHQASRLTASSRSLPSLRARLSDSRATTGVARRSWRRRLPPE